MLVRARAPLRLGLAGGGTDVSPYSDIHGGCVLNATIDRYAYASIKTYKEPIIRFVATDQNLVEEYDIDDTQFSDSSSGLVLHRKVYQRIIEEFNGGRPIPLELSTYCDAPAGSGLGSSSTVVVTMLKAFNELLNLPLDDYSLASLAFEIERIDCGFAGGRQDQYAACFGGVNFMEFYADDKAIINPLRVKNWIMCELEASLILFYTGVSRESAHIIADQSSNVKMGNSSALEAMHAIKDEAIQMKESLLKGDFAGIVDSMRAGWENKKRSARSVSNSHINQIYEDVCEHGAVAGKVSGAGGGGFMMFFVPPERRLEVVRTLGKYKGQVSNCHFTKHGCQGWRLK